MKTAYLASILALVAVTAFACNDDEDRVKDGPGRAGSANQAGTPNGEAGSGSGLGGNGEVQAGGGGGASAGAGPDSQAGEAGESSSGGVGGEAGGGANEAGGNGEGGAGGAGEPEPLELIGEYDNNYGGEEIITADAWNDSDIAGYDNDGNVVYLQLPADDQFNPSKFTKVVYTEPTQGAFFYCWVAFGLDTLAAAQASNATADASDPATSGCGGFPWTKATAQ